MPVTPPVCDFGWKAPDFTLPSTDGREVSLSDAMGSKGLLVMFICNHCPYVLAVLDRIIRDASELMEMGIGVVAISANDAEAYPKDSFDNMKLMAEAKGFSFPYLYDEMQDVARAYDAACTPDFFGFDADGGLQYRGRLDASTRAAGPADQIPSMGCSIKWKTG